MPGRFNSIDLGPMSLPFFQQTEINDTKFDTASRFDIEKLNSLLSDGGNNDHGLEPEEECKKLPNVDWKNFINSLADSEKIFELSSIASKFSSSLATQSNKSIIACAEIKIRENILPNSTIKASKNDNKFYFDLCIGDEYHQKWIVHKLPDLVRQIGERIKSPLVISVFSLENRVSAIATCDWPEVE